MILGGLFRKIKWIIILIVVVTIIYWIVKLWRWKPLLKEMISKEVSLAEAISRVGKGSPSKQPDQTNDTPSETKDDDFDYLSRRVSDFLSGPPRRKKVQAPGVNVQDEEENVEKDEEENVEEKEHRGRDPVRRTNSKVSTYKREEICRKVLEDYFDDYFPTCRPKFLANPKTGYPLELDGYNAAKNLAFEHNGAHHYKYPNSFHRNEEEFNSQVERDEYKKARCKELGIDLIEIPYNVPVNQIETFIHSELKRLKK